MIKKLYNNFLNSINGLKFIFKEHSFIVEIIGGFILVPYVIFLETSIFFKLLIITVYLFLLSNLASVTDGLLIISFINKSNLVVILFLL